MKASPVMFFAYITMIGVPVLLLVLAGAALFTAPPLMFLILLILIAVGCIIYGAIGIREVFVHGHRRAAAGAAGGAADGTADNSTQGPAPSREAAK